MESSATCCTGIVFCDLQTFRDKAKVDKPIVLYVREGNNDWRQQGLYSSKSCYGEITTKHLSLLPPSVGVWVKGALNSSGWGNDWIEEVNADIEKKEPECIKYTEEGLTAALYVRLNIMMKCVGYCRDWDDRCLYYKDQPKPAKKKKLQKKRASGKQVTPAKKVAKVEIGRAVVKEESEVTDSEAEYVE
jgi:alpha-L-fucosidase